MLLEAVEVLLGLEADEVVGEQRADQRLVLRQRREDLGRRERRVQEEADALPHAAPAQFLGERDQVEVVHPHQVAGAEQPRERLREPGVDPSVGLELAALEAHQVDAEMHQRPQAVVAEAVVVVLEILLRQVERRQGDRPRASSVCSCARPAGAVRPLQPNQSPPRSRSASTSPTASPPAAAAPRTGPTRLETATSRPAPLT